LRVCDVAHAIIEWKILRLGLFEFRFAASTGDDGASGLQELLGQRQADARCAACDENDIVVELHRGYPVKFWAEIVSKGL